MLSLACLQYKTLLAFDTGPVSQKPLGSEEKLSSSTISDYETKIYSTLVNIISTITQVTTDIETGTYSFRAQRGKVLTTDSHHEDSDCHRTQYIDGNESL